jgi:2-polyprenyl-3-methyl-5-hydroxy-6-metoxy-1,4-benzoquinol methylase
MRAPAGLTPPATLPAVGDSLRGRCCVCSREALDSLMVALGASELRRCGSCGSWVYWPRPTAAEQIRLHDSSDYFEHPYFRDRRAAKAAASRRAAEALRFMRASLDPRVLAGERLLDIGCDTGLFLLALAEQADIVPVGIDVAARSVAEAQASGVEAYVADIESAPKHVSGLLAITAVDVLEHVVEPRSFLEQVRDRLRVGGICFVQTPNILSSVYALGRLVSKLVPGNRSAALQRLFPPQHIQYLTPTSFEALARSCGLNVAKLRTCSLPAADLAVHPAVKTALTPLQLFDRARGTGILIQAVLRKSRCGEAAWV